MARSLFGMTSHEAWEKRICIQCRTPITKENVITDDDIAEYAISGLCSVCFPSKTPPKSRDEVLDA